VILYNDKQFCFFGLLLNNTKVGFSTTVWNPEGLQVAMGRRKVDSYHYLHTVQISEYNKTV